MRNFGLFVVLSTLFICPALIAAAGGNQLSLDKSTYVEGEAIVASHNRGGKNKEKARDWIGIYSRGQIPALITPSSLWLYVCGDQTCISPAVDSGSLTFGPNAPDESGSTSFPLATGNYDAYYIEANSYNVLAGPVEFTVTAQGGGGGSSLTLDKTSYTVGEDIVSTFNNDGTAYAKDWIGVYSRGETPGGPASDIWLYVCGTQTCSNPATSSGSLTFGSANPDESGSTSFPLYAGDYDAYYLANDGYSVIAGPFEFSITGQSGGGNCNAATTLPSSNTHITPTEGATISNIAFGSCYKPSSQTNNKLWNHVRNTFGAELFVWMGDNMYSDGTNMESKRIAYNAARDDTYYSNYGPIASPKIPVTGTWDDHDFGSNNEGINYECQKESQDEFVTHFNVPSTDPRHKDYAGGQQVGVYSAHMFSKPGGGNGIHVINLDARSSRDPTFSTYGPCQGDASQMLDATQWAWLDTELARTSEIKIISSGTQVLPPTHQGRSLSSYCAYEGSGSGFLQAISDVGENADYKGTHYESWGEMPKERAKLLQKAQKAINDGYASKIIFISGDQHWAEIMAKKMPQSATYGAAQVLHEVTASGIDQKWNMAIENSNRLRERTADFNGDGKYFNECNFPFKYGGTTYYDCTNVGSTEYWCSIETDSSDNHVTGQWGNCLPIAEELSETYGHTGADICTDSYHHVCNAQANYGGINVDWTNRKIRMSIYTPHVAGQEEASFHEISF